MIVGILIALLGVLFIIVGLKGDRSISKTRQEMVAAWDEMKGRLPEYTEKRYKKPNKAVIFIGMFLVLFGILNFFGG